jgi:hypothetical protein
MTKKEKIKMLELEYDLALEKAQRTLDRLEALGEQVQLIYRLEIEPIEQIRPWWLFWK